MQKPILEVKDLHTYFYTPEGLSKAVEGVSFSLNAGEVLALVGESGCGKSVTCLSLLRLIQYPPGKIEKGQILWHNQDLLKLSKRDMRKIRGAEISMIFQEPMTALNPVYTIGYQIKEALITHKKNSRKEAKEKIIKLIEQVGIPEPEERIDAYPHQLSGGLRQRAMIAMALICEPQVLIADEPTTAVDVTVQAQILELLQKLQAEKKLSIILVTHDLGIVAEVADKINVMYAGQIVEYSSVKYLYTKPLHPYTQGLLASVPRLGNNGCLQNIPGTVPSPLNFPAGCRFHPRCTHKMPQCVTTEPPLFAIDNEINVKCWLYGKTGA